MQNCRATQCSRLSNLPSALCAGGEALPRLVNRTVKVNQEQWLALHKSSQSTAVQDKSEKPGKILKVIKRSTRLDQLSGCTASHAAFKCKHRQIHALPAGDTCSGTRVCLSSTLTLKLMHGGVPICYLWMALTPHSLCQLGWGSIHQVFNGIGSDIGILLQVICCGTMLHVLLNSVPSSILHVYSSGAALRSMPLLHLHMPPCESELCIYSSTAFQKQALQVAECILPARINACSNSLMQQSFESKQCQKRSSTHDLRQAHTLFGAAQLGQLCCHRADPLTTIP